MGGRRPPGSLPASRVGLGVRNSIMLCPKLGMLRYHAVFGCRLYCAMVRYAMVLYAMLCYSIVLYGKLGVFSHLASVLASNTRTHPHTTALCNTPGHRQYSAIVSGLAYHFPTHSLLSPSLSPHFLLTSFSLSPHILLNFSPISPHFQTIAYFFCRLMFHLCPFLNLRGAQTFRRPYSSGLSPIGRPPGRRPPIGGGPLEPWLPGPPGSLAAPAT